MVFGYPRTATYPKTSRSPKMPHVSRVGGSDASGMEQPNDITEELKLYENKLKQKDLARLLHTTDTKLSEIMHNKRKPSVSFLKAMHEVLGIDGNLLLKIA